MIASKNNQIKNAGYFLSIATVFGLVNQPLSELVSIFGASSGIILSNLEIIKSLCVAEGARKISKIFPNKLNDDLEILIKKVYKDTIDDITEDTIKRCDLNEPFLRKVNNFIRQEKSECIELKQRLKEEFCKPLFNALTNEEEIGKMIKNNNQLAINEYVKIIISEKSLTFNYEEGANDHEEFVNFISEHFREHFREHFLVELKNNERAKDHYSILLIEAIFENTKENLACSYEIKEDTSHIRTIENNTEIILKKISDKNYITENKEDRNTPDLPKEVAELLKQAGKTRNEGRFDEAKTIYIEALKLSKELNDDYSIAKSKLELADNLRAIGEYTDEILQNLIDCENYFRDNKNFKDLADALFQLSIIKLQKGQLDDARIKLNEALEIKKEILHNKLGEAECYLIFGRIEYIQGHLDKSKEYYNKSIEIYELEYSKQDNQVITNRIGDSYNQLALLNEEEGKLFEADFNFNKALKYHRDSGFKLSIADTLYLLAKLCLYGTKQNKTGLVYLNESIEMFKDIKVWNGAAKALNLLGLFYYNSDDKEKGIRLINNAIDEIEKTDDDESKLIYYGCFADLLKIEQKDEEAEKLYLKIIDISKERNYYDKYLNAIIQLIEFYKKRGKKEAILLAKDNIKIFKDIYANTQGESKRAEILMLIGTLYFESENNFDAKKYFFASKDAYGAISNIKGVIKSLIALAHMYRLDGDLKREIESYQEIYRLTEGTYYYYEQLLSLYYLCLFEIDNKNFRQARKYFDNAEYLNYSYALNFDLELDELMDRLDKSIDSYQNTDNSIKELIMDFYSLVNYYPKERRHLLRFWLFFYGNELFNAIRNEEGLKFFFITNDTDKFLRLSTLLNSYSNFNIQSFDEGFKNSGKVLFHYPCDRLLPKGLSALGIKKGQRYSDIRNVEFYIPKISREEYEKSRNEKSEVKQIYSGIPKRYIICLDKSENQTKKTTKLLKELGLHLESYDGFVIMGNSVIFPKQFETLLLNSTADDILSKKIFFDLSDRSKDNDKYYSDLNVSESLGCIPIFENMLPKSDNVIVIESVFLELPICTSNEINNMGNKIEIKKIKYLIIETKAKINKSDFTLQKLKISLDKLNDQNQLPKVMLQAFLLELETFDGKEKQRQLSFVYKDF